MPRKRRWKAYRVTSFYIPIEFEHVMEKAQRLASKEGRSLSMLIVDAIAEYVERRMPGEA